ncbi:MAG: proton-conducting transporter membrane subunit [Halobacteria archaeon]
MSQQNQKTTAGQLPVPEVSEPRLPSVLTKTTWLLWIISLGILALNLWSGETPELGSLMVIDGLTVVMWVTVTFFSGIIHSYSRRYMEGSRYKEKFFTYIFCFTLTVMLLVASNGFVIFLGMWLLMGLIMSELIGYDENWTQAKVSESLARKYFLASTVSLGVGLTALFTWTGSTTITGTAIHVLHSDSLVLFLAAGSILLAAMIQSALVPFHSWLMASMTAPTPASALMHAGFVNAGGILLVRFAPVVNFEPGFMLVVVLAGASSALLGKLMKTVQTDVKGMLGCSTVGQMGFMIMQAGLGFFAAAITHLILHGFYKAYQFLSSGSNVSHESPGFSESGDSLGFTAVLVVAATGLAAAVLFALLTGKGTKLNGGVILTILVVLTVMDATYRFAALSSVPAVISYGAVPLIALPSIVIYAAAYNFVEGMLIGLPAVGQPVDLNAIHAVIGLAFVAAYLAIETGIYRRSRRLYVTLLNASRPPNKTVLTEKEDYNEH